MSELRMDIDNPEFRKELLIMVMEMASMNDARMNILADWLRTYEDFNVLDGALEEKVHRAKVEAVQQVGEYLMEILQLPNEQLLAISIEIKEKRNGYNNSI